MTMTIEQLEERVNVLMTFMRLVVAKTGPYTGENKLYAGFASEPPKRPSGPGTARYAEDATPGWEVAMVNFIRNLDHPDWALWLQFAEFLDTIRIPHFPPGLEPHEINNLHDELNELAAVIVRFSRYVKARSDNTTKKGSEIRGMRGNKAQNPPAPNGIPGSIGPVIEYLEALQAALGGDYAVCCEARTAPRRAIVVRRRGDNQIIEVAEFTEVGQLISPDRWATLIKDPDFAEVEEPGEQIWEPGGSNYTTEKPAPRRMPFDTEADPDEVITRTFGPEEVTIGSELRDEDVAPAPWTVSFIKFIDALRERVGGQLDYRWVGGGWQCKFSYGSGLARGTSGWFGAGVWNRDQAERVCRIIVGRTGIDNLIEIIDRFFPPEPAPAPRMKPVIDEEKPWCDHVWSVPGEGKEPHCLYCHIPKPRPGDLPASQEPPQAR